MTTKTPRSPFAGTLVPAIVTVAIALALVLAFIAVSFTQRDSGDLAATTSDSTPSANTATQDDDAFKALQTYTGTEAHATAYAEWQTRWNPDYSYTLEPSTCVPPRPDDVTPLGDDATVIVYCIATATSLADGMEFSAVAMSQLRYDGEDTKIIGGGLGVGADGEHRIAATPSP